MKDLKYLPSFSELIDRLSIVQLKEIFIPDNKDNYSKEIEDIVHDLNEHIKENNVNEIFNGELIRAVIVLAQTNLHIWHNESEYRKNASGNNNLELTHQLNGIRNTAKNIIQSVLGGRKDYKIDCLSAEYNQWVPSGYESK